MSTTNTTTNLIATAGAAPSLERVSRLFHALSDPTRLGIVRKLARGERCVCDLQDAVGSYQSRLSFHLKRLKDAGVVSDRKEGRWVYYRLRPEVLEQLSGFLGQLVEQEGAWEAGCEPAEGGCCS